MHKLSRRVWCFRRGDSSGSGCHVKPWQFVWSRPPALPWLRGTMATIIYWLSASFPPMHPGSATMGHGGRFPSVSSLRGYSGKTISVKHLDRLFSVIPRQNCSCLGQSWACRLRFAYRHRPLKVLCSGVTELFRSLTLTPSEGKSPVMCESENESQIDQAGGWMTGNHFVLVPCIYSCSSLAS